MCSKGILAALVLVFAVVSGPAHALGRKPTGSPSPATDGTAWVKRPDGTQQCSMDGKQSEASLEKGARELEKAGIPVLNRQKTSDGKMRIQLCGSPTGKEDAYQIRATDLERARALGFVDGTELKHGH
jgi:hypothetical protein